MQIDEKKLLQQRWAMLTNPFALKIPPICKHTEIEISDHLKLIDMVCDGRRFTDSEMEQCEQRFRRFCRTQWLNQSRN